MSRSGPRPHVWKVQGEVPHKQYLAWLQMKAQASYRDEAWQFSFEDFQQAWLGKWDRKGRAKDDYCLSRRDPDQPWSGDNVECIPRIEHLRKSGHRRKELRANGKLKRRQPAL